MLKRRERRRVGPMPINSLIPNMLTVLALSAGMTSIRFALQDKWEAAVLAIVVAAVLDGLDGRMARLLKGATKFGAELDSLSDFIAFGVAPAFIVYLWSLHFLGGIGWVVALGFAACCALRLARFNTALESEVEEPNWSKDFFVGVAAPAGAGFGLMPVVASFLFGDEVFRQPVLVALWMVLIAYFMVSRIPTFSFKRLRIGREYVLPTLIVVCLTAAVTVTYPWIVYTIVGVGYFASIPYSVLHHRRLRRRAVVAETKAPESDGEV